jgi:hypothetical protein
VSTTSWSSSKGTTRWIAAIRIHGSKLPAHLIGNLKRALCGQRRVRAFLPASKNPRFVPSI